MKTFFEALIPSEASQHKAYGIPARLAKSFLLFLIKLLTLKYTVLKIGLNSKARLKMPSFMLSRVCHCMTNDMGKETETAQREQAKNFYKEGKSLPFLP